MSQTQLIRYVELTHAPLFRRYIDGEFREVGEPPEAGKPWRIHAATDAEIHALQHGEPHTYLTDYKVGSSYPATTFVFGMDGASNMVGHDELERFMREHGLWSDALNPVATPTTTAERWHFGFQFRPPERAPYNLTSVESRLASLGMETTHLGSSVEGWFR